MDKSNNIDQLFNQLKDHQLPVSDDIWEYISADQKKKKRAFGLWWFYAAIGLILIGGLIGYYQIKINPEQLAKIIKSKNTIKSEVQQPVVEPKFESTQNNETYNQSANFNHSYSSPVGEYNTSYKNTKSLNQSLNQDNNQDNNSKNEEHIFYSRSEEKSSDNMAKQNDLDEKNEKPTNELEKKEKPPIRKIKKEKVSKWYMESSLIYSYSFRSLNSNANFQNYINQRNANEVAITSPGMSIACGYSIAKNWNIRTGLLYNIQGMSSSYTVNTSLKKTYVGFDPSHQQYDTSKQLYTYMNDSAFLLEKGNAINGDQKYHYIKIPFQLEFLKDIKKFTIYINGGIGFNILVKTRGDIQDYQSSQAGIFTPIEDISTRSFGMDINTRTGVLMPVFGYPKLKINIGFIGMYSPFSVFKHEIPFKQNNYSFAIEMGLRKSL